MYHIPGRAKSGKNFLLSKVAVNTLLTKMIGRAMAKSLDPSMDKTLSLVSPYFSNACVIRRDDFRKQKMVYDSYDELLTTIKQSEVLAADAIALLNSKNFFNIEGEYVRSSDSVSLDGEGSFIKGVTPDKQLVLARVNFDNDELTIVDAWLPVSALERGIAADGVITLCYEGFCELPEKYQFLKDSSKNLNPVEDSDLVNKLSSLINEWSKYKKILNTKKDIHSFCMGISKDDLNTLDKESGKFVRDYRSTIVLLTQKKSVLNKVLAKNDIQTSDVFQYEDSNGKTIAIVKHPSVIPFTLISTPCFIDSMLPLAFSQGAAATGGISVRALSICSKTTYKECFVTFPTQSFLGVDNSKWDPLLTGEFKQAGDETKFKAPFYYTSRLTQRSIDHLLLDTFEKDGHVLSVSHPSVGCEKVYIFLDDVPVVCCSFSTAINRGLIRMIQKTGSSIAECVSWDDVVEMITEYSGVSNESKD